MTERFSRAQPSNRSTTKGLCVISVCVKKKKRKKKKVCFPSCLTCIWCMTENTRGCHDVIWQTMCDITCRRGAGWRCSVNIYIDAQMSCVAVSQQTGRLKPPLQWVQRRVKEVLTKSICSKNVFGTNHHRTKNTNTASSAVLDNS